MATLTHDFADTFLPYASQTIMQQKGWSTGGSITPETVGTFSGERVFAAGAGSGSQRSLRLNATVGYLAMKTRVTVGPQSASLCMFTSSTQGTGFNLHLYVNAAGKLELGTNLNVGAATILGTAPLAQLVSVNTYYAVELAFFVVPGGLCSVETRLNGQRIPELTTLDIGAAGPHLAGTMTRPTQYTSANFPTIGGIKLGGGQNVAWVLVKRGAALWHFVESVTPPTTYAQASDFIGDAKRAWLPDDGAGNYAIGGANRWTMGAGSYVGGIADATGVVSTTSTYPPTGNGADSDTSYAVNTTNAAGSPGANDRLSHTYSNLPATATRVHAVQKFIQARSAQSSLAQLRTFYRTGGADLFDFSGAADVNELLALSASNYAVFTRQWTTQPHAVNNPTGNGTGGALWTPTLVNAIESGFELYRLEP